MRNLRAINLNLIPVLRAVLRFRNVTHAARSLDVSPSSVSEMLGLLRHLFEDELLIPQGKNFQLTALAERLDRQLRTVLEPLDALAELTVPVKFPHARSLNIALNDYSSLVVGDPLVRYCQSVQPDLTLHLHDIDESSAIYLLEGGLDFLIAPEIPLGLTDPQFARLALVKDRMVCIVDEKSGIVDHVDEEQYAAAPHVFLKHNPGIYNASRTTILQHVGENRMGTVLTDCYSLIPFLVEGTDAMALVLKRAIDAIRPSPRVRVVEAPFDIRLSTFAYWDDSRPRDPVQRWFVSILRSFASKMAGGDGYQEAADLGL